MFTKIKKIKTKNYLKFLAILIISLYLSSTTTEAETINLTEYIAGPDFTSHDLSTGEHISFSGEPGNGGVRQYKNSNYEQFFIKSDGYYRREDTSWAPVEGFNDAHCFNGNKAIYALDPGCSPNPFPVGQEVTSTGAFWAPNSASVGKSWQTGAHQIVPIDSGVGSGNYSYSLPPLISCQLVELNNYPACVGQGNQIIELTAHYPANSYTFCTGSTNPVDLIIITVKSGPGVGDTFFFGKGYGLMGFETPGFEAGYMGENADPSACKGSNNWIGDPSICTVDWLSNAKDKEFCEGGVSPFIGGNYGSNTTDPDCPGKTVFPYITTTYFGPSPAFSVDDNEQNDISTQGCVSFSKSADAYCLEYPEDVTFTFTVTTHDCTETVTNILIDDQGLEMIIPIRDLDLNDQETANITVRISSDMENIATLSAINGEENINIANSAHVIIGGPGGCNGCSLSVPYFCQRDYPGHTCDPANQDIPGWGCGITSEAMISAFHGGGANATPTYICDNYGISMNHGGAKDLIGRNLQYVGTSCNQEDYFETIRRELCDSGMPLVAHYKRPTVSYGHFVVVVGIDLTNRTVISNDPWYSCANGANPPTGGSPITYTFDEFFSWAKDRDCSLWH